MLKPDRKNQASFFKKIICILQKVLYIRIMNTKQVKPISKKNKHAARKAARCLFTLGGS